ncbi:hypothetical protein I4U23_001351 [Adineta vaga]|nr:hypothetical protein I4U23_001351 [Adineta vaga]
MLSFRNVRRIQSNPIENRQQLHAMHRKDFQLLRSLYYHDLVHTSFSISAAMYYTYEAATKYQTRTILHRTIDNFLNGFGIISHHIPFCLSFFIFIHASKIFRLEIKRVLCKISARCLVLK